MKTIKKNVKIKISLRLYDPIRNLILLIWLNIALEIFVSVSDSNVPFDVCFPLAPIVAVPTAKPGRLVTLVLLMLDQVRRVLVTLSTSETDVRISRLTARSLRHCSRHHSCRF